MLILKFLTRREKDKCNGEVDRYRHLERRKTREKEGVCVCNWIFRFVLRSYSFFSIVHEIL